MKFQLILAGPYTSCQHTHQIWGKACDDRDLKLEIINLDSETGQTLEKDLNIKSFPALIVDGQVKAVGHPDAASAAELISKLLNQT